MALALWAAAATAGACGDDIVGPARQQATADGYRVVFAPRPWPLTVGRHLEVELVVCTPPGRPPATALAIDADMPVHRHGMNYRATLRPLGDGRYLASGLLLHMPGRWRFSFELRADERPLRATSEIELE